MNTPHPDKLPRTQLHDDLIAEVLSWLPVKSLTRLRCVCKSWNTLIFSDHSFTKLHLHRSALRNPQLLQRVKTGYDHSDFYITHLSGSGLVENPWILLAHNPRYRLKEGDRYRVVGSCNGLICLHGSSKDSVFRQRWLSFWNPATRLMSKKLGLFFVKSNYKLSFGYDNSTDTYKVVFFEIKKIPRASQVSVFTLGCNVWRDIKKSPMFPFNYFLLNAGVNLSGTLNWMASRNESTLYIAENIAVEQLVILSLDLGTETYTLLSPPKGFDEVPCVEPSIGVLMDNLCFSHDLKRTHFVIWHMKEFGDVESWVQLLKISYQDLDWEPLDEYVYVTYQLFPLCLYNGDTLVLGSFRDDQAILYDKRANTVERTTLTTKSKNILLLSDYVESLVWPLSVNLILM